MYLIFSIVAGLFAVLGGLLPLFLKVKGIRYWIGLASGLMISTVIFEMLPEIGSLVALAVGFFFIYVLEKVLMIHACGESECKTHKISWVSLLSMGADNLIDGMAIVTGYLVNPLAGLIVALAVAMHEGVQSFSATVIMKKGKYTRQKILFTALLFGVTIPIGALLSRSFLSVYYKEMLAFAAGIFIYVGASDMLPEAHKRFNLKVIMAVLIGAAVVPLLELVLESLT